MKSPTQARTPKGRKQPHFGPDGVTVFAIRLNDANTKAEPHGPNY